MKYLVIAAIFLCGSTAAWTEETVNPPGDFTDASVSDRLLDHANASFKRSEYVNALKELEDALKFCPNNARAKLESAIRKHTSRDFTGARDDLIAANRAYPRLAQIFVMAGTARMMIKDHYGAVSDLSMAIYITPLNSRTYYWAYTTRAQARQQLDDLQGAIDDFNVYIAAPGLPELQVSYLFRGMARSDLGDENGATSDFTAAILVAPKFGIAYYQRSLQFRKMGDLQRALTDCNALIKLEPDRPIALRIRSWIYQDLNDPEAARRDADMALSLNPDAPDYWMHRAALYEAEDQPEPAIADYRKAIELSEIQSKRESWIYASFFLDLLLQRSGQGKLGDYLKDVNDWPDDWSKRIALYLAGRLTDESLLKAAKIAPNRKVRIQQECEASYYIGMINLLKGSDEVAQGYFTRSVETNQVTFTEYYLARARLKKLQKAKAP